MELKKLNLFTRIDLWLVLLLFGLFIYAADQEVTTFNIIIFFTFIFFIVVYAYRVFYYYADDNSNIHRKPKKSETITIVVKEEFTVGGNDDELGEEYFYYLYTRTINIKVKLSSFVSNKILDIKSVYIVNSEGNFILQK